MSDTEDAGNEMVEEIKDTKKKVAGKGAASKGAGGKKFEVKKWNAVALWAWGTRSRHHRSHFASCDGLVQRSN